MIEEGQRDGLVELWRAFASAWKKWYRKAEENISPLDISIHEYRMMSYLVENGPTSMARLANSIDVSQGWITSMVDRLEAKSMVRRTRNDEDWRIIRIEVLPEGAQTIDRAKELHLQIVRRTMGRFSENDQQKFMELLIKLASGLEE